MRFLPGNAQHIGARHSQQDSFGFADPDDAAFIAHAGFLAVVCDGMGGMEYGDAASRTAVKVFLEAYQRKTPAESIPDALERSVREANNQVVAMAHSLGLAEGIGTTLVAAAVSQTSLYYISVGDSGLFHCTGGDCRMINRPHIFANILDAAVARGNMSREDAEQHPERESLTSFIGTETLEEIDRNVEPYPLSPGDTILLASDGMFKTLDPDEIRGSLEGHPQSWPDLLVDRTLARQREYQDNVTVLSVTLETEEQAAMPRTTIRLKPAVAATPVGVAASPLLPPPPPSAAVMQVPPPAWTPPVNPVPPPQPTQRGWWPLMVVLLLFAVGIAGWWYTKHRKVGELTPGPSITDPALKRTGPPPIPAPSDKPDPELRGPADPNAPQPASPTPVPNPTTPAPTTPVPPSPPPKK